MFARHAWNAYTHAKWSEFSDLTRKGLEYDKQNPDLLCFRGLEARRAGQYSEASQWFSKAYYSGFQPEQVSTKEILGWLFEVQFRLGYDEELETLFFTINDLTRDDPDHPFLYSTSLSIGLETTEKAVELAARGVYRFQDQRFLILLSSWSDDTYYPGILSEVY